MNEIEVQAMLQELEAQRGWAQTRCAQLAAALASMTKKYEDSEKVVKQLSDELTELRPKDVN